LRLRATPDTVVSKMQENSHWHIRNHLPRILPDVQVRTEMFRPLLAPYKSLDEGWCNTHSRCGLTRSITQSARFIAVFLRFKVRGGYLSNYLLREIPIEVGKKTESNFVLTWLSRSVCC